MLSIIVPVYNEKKYIRQCLDSILNQTYMDFELILIDDGSKDNSSYICDEYALKDNRVKVIHKNNEGLSATRNLGLKISKGEFISFIDSDDWIAKDMFQILMNNIVKYKADISCGQIVRKNSDVINDDNKVFKEIKTYSRNEYAKLFFKVNSRKTIHYAVNKVYKRDVVRNMKFPNGLINEDVEGFFYALKNAKKIVTDSSAIYYYRNNGESISSEMFSKKQMDLITVWNHVNDACSNESYTWQSYARINCARAYMGLLVRLAISHKENIYKKEKDYLLRCLKRNEKELLFSDILPVERKMIVWALCRNYLITSYLIRGLYKLKRNLNIA